MGNLHTNNPAIFIRNDDAEGESSRSRVIVERKDAIRVSRPDAAAIPPPPPTAPQHPPRQAADPEDGHPLSVDPAAHDQAARTTTQRGHGGHGLVMILMCLPMVLIVGLLVATGVAGAGAVLFVVLCMAMMAAMVFMMPGGHSHK